MALQLLKKNESPAGGAHAAAPAEAATHYEWPSAAKPSAMLVPTYIRENRALAVTKRKAYFGVLVVLLVAVAGVATSFLLNITSKGALEDATSERDAAQQKVKTLAPIAEYYDGLDARNKATVALLANDVSHGALWQHVTNSLPSGTKTLSYKTTFGTPCLGPDPFEASQVIGCITVAGVANSTGSPAEFLNNLKRGQGADMVTDGFVNSVVSSDGEVKFTVNVNFTPQALSLKYVDDPAAIADPANSTATQDGSQ